MKVLEVDIKLAHIDSESAQARLYWLPPSPGAGC